MRVVVFIVILLRDLFQPVPILLASQHQPDVRYLSLFSGIEAASRSMNIHMARVYLRETIAQRKSGRKNHGWHATLLRWAANRRMAAMQSPRDVVQGDLFVVAQPQRAAA
jgi:hypothetical protein